MDSLFMFDKIEDSAAKSSGRRHGQDQARPAPRRPHGDPASKFPAADFFLLDGGQRSAFRRIRPIPADEPRRFDEARREQKRLHGDGPRRKRDRSEHSLSRAALRVVFAPLRMALFLARTAGKIGIRGFQAAGKLRPAGREVGNPPSFEAKAAVRAAEAAPRISAASRTARRAKFRFNRGLAIASAAPILLVAAVGMTMLVAPRFPLPQGGLVENIPSAQDDLLDFMTPELSKTVTEASLPPLPVSLATDSYTVARGDSLGSIAAQYHIDIDTLVSMNGISSAKSLEVGQELKIPNLRGVVHVVKKGESLASIAASNKISVAVIADANNLGSSVLIPGQAVFLPGVHLAPFELRRVFGVTTIWPVKGVISSWFGYRPDPFTGVRSFHGGIDLAVAMGTPVKAAMDGRVADVNYSQLFGNYIILAHDGGLQTLYGHLSLQKVKIGEAIAQGEIIGLSGNTGYSTAPHLHFGIYKNGVAVNPLKYLK